MSTVRTPQKPNPMKTYESAMTLALLFGIYAKDSTPKHFEWLFTAMCFLWVLIALYRRVNAYCSST